MKNNLFDSFVREQLADSRPDVPAHIWENIVAKKDRKKPVVFWLNNYTKIGTFLFLLLTGAGIFIYFNNNKKDPTIINEVSTIIKKADQIGLQKNIIPVNKKVIIEDFTKKVGLDIILKNNKNINSFTPANAVKIVTEIDTKQMLFTPVTNTNDFEKNSIKYYTVAKQILNVNLLKNSFFNPQLKQRKLPLLTFIPCPEIEKNAAGSKRYIEIYGGPDYVFRNLSDTANSVYLQQRKASIKYQFAYSAGIRYTRVFGSGMSFRTGLNYSQINEQFTAENGRVIQNIYITNSNGDTTGSYIQTGTLYKKNTNKYRSIDIPISIGYELGNGKIHSNINAGAMVNISSSQNGFVIDKNGKVVDISSKNSSSIYQYKTKAGVSFIGAVSIYYKLNEHLHLMAEPYVKLALSPATKEELSLKEKFHTAGVRFGVRKDF